MTAQDSRARQTECDLLVVGSGAGGLSAATTAAWHGLRVVVVEKDRVCGGATAWSGGWAWVPLNPLAQADGLGIMAGPDLQAFLHATRSPKAFAHASWRIGWHVFDLATRRQGMQLVNGPALIARLLKSADDLGVELWVSSPAKRLLIDDGAVQGAVVETSGGEVTIRARCGTVLAAGGFPGDVGRRRELFPRTPTGQEHWTLAPASCSGDGISLGQSAGGQLETRLASPVAWCPVSLVSYRSGRVGVYPHIVDRGKPGLIAVLADGRRFVNEADGYYDFVSAMVRAVPEGQEVASWLICDHAFQRRYPFGMSKPFPVPVWPYLRSGYLKRGRTLDELARTCGIDPTGLKRTIGQFNRHAATGKIRNSAVAAPRSTAVPAILTTSRIPRSRRSQSRRSTRSRCCRAASAPSPGSGPTPAPECSTRPATRFPACTRSAATRPA